MDRTNQSPSSFRLDINGLRAYAVVVVVLYHFGVPGFGGGFGGVDVFFVISGFLMTKIITSGLMAGTFSLLGFYLARAKRIVPALVAVCAALLALGWFALSETDYKALASNSVYSLAFLSNIEYWLQAGYFDIASHKKWLLHTWSLSVEWQFYLVLPILLSIFWWFYPSRRTFGWVLCFGIVFSFGSSVYITANDPSLAFYLLHTRAWEMLAGGLLALNCLPERRTSKVIEILGFILIFAAILLFDHNSIWPGWRAAIPVFGACLIIYANRKRSFLTANIVAQRLGDWSYSLYLWHWPVVVALGYFDLLQVPSAIVLGLGCTIIFGALSYRYIETGTRRILNLPSHFKQITALVVMTTLVAVPAVAIHKQGGFSGRMPETVEIAAREAENKNPRRDVCHISKGVKPPSCIFGGEELAAIVLGDSHANAAVTAVAEAVPNPKGGVMEWSYTGCSTLIGARRINLLNPDYSCSGFNEWVLSALESEQDPSIPVIMISRSSAHALGPNERSNIGYGKPTVYFSQPFESPDPFFLEEFRESLIRTSCEIAKRRPVYLVRPIPEMVVDVPTTLAHRLLVGWTENVSISIENYHQRHSYIWQAQDEARERCGVKILNPLPYLCDAKQCYGAQNGRPLYYDDDHLSEYGNKRLVPMFEEVFSKAVVSAKAAEASNAREI